jgi:microcystin-dependent protein
LPDLRGRVPIQPGQGNGLSNRSIGEVGGTETITLSLAQIPSHTHSMTGSAANGVSDSPVGGVPARMPSAIPEYGATPDGNLAAAAVANSGGAQPHNNMQPYLTVNYIIALQGVFPPRS